MADNLATMYHKVKELNSSLYCRPSLTVSLYLPSQTYQISGNRYLVDMFLSDDTIAKMKELWAEILGQNDNMVTINDFCNNCSARAPIELKPCHVCYKVKYCSRKCQVNDLHLKCHASDH